MLTCMPPSFNLFVSVFLLGFSVYINASQNSTAEFNVSHTPSLNNSNGTDPYPEVMNKTGGPSISAYQSLNIKTKPKPDSVGSQEAPEHATSGLLTRHSSGKPKKHIFCYYGSSANSRPELGKFWPENIDPFLCTHLIFAFVDITEDGTGLRPNNWNDLGENGLYARTMKLKVKNPDLKILLAVGGWKIGSTPFLPVIESEATWKTWAQNVILYLRKFGFDGFDMDWEFPGWRGSGPEDRHKFTLMMKELYEGFAEESKSSGKERLLLTLAAASSAFYVEKSYEQSEIHKYIDYMLLMTYNYHGSGWEKQTGHHSPLLPHPLDPEGEQRELYILWSVKYWLNHGVPREKIVIGLATYGLGWKLVDETKTGVRAPADGGNTKGKYTEESGILSHYEICEHILNDGWKVEWIEEQKVPYAYGQGEWIGFDSPDSFYLKAITIIKEGLAGAFVWSVEMDDFNGHCGGPKYPMLRTIYEVFTQSSSVSNLKLSDIKSDLSGIKSDLPSIKSESASLHSHGDHHSASAAASGAHDHSSEHTHDGSHSSEHTHDGSHEEMADYNVNDEGTAIDFDCHSSGLGIHPDPSSCHHFILCTPSSQSEMGAFKMSCPSGTLYDAHLKICNHQHNVHCVHD
ncbi:chitinase-like protein 3 [Physella acuta]|uniref:chitinase-like protein 3 n=1 Tax=Physella acuta TaxID=109671 RepID=UPI0027DC9BAC|nr:chitinase-like protein 3 [Physella acuta]